jgi:diguanylate cyclase (GGDEF)-like protein/PAS domain S-box-containing protein
MSSQDKYTSVVSSFQEIAYFDVGECLRVVNKPHREGFSQGVAEMPSRTLKEVLGSEEYAKRKPHIEAALAGRRVTFERRMPGNGRTSHLQIDYLPELDAAEQVIGVFALAQDITRRKQHEERLVSAALHDPLTGLANRQLLADRVSLAIAHARRNTCASAVVYLDLDGFKEVNDTLGHDAGDHLLEMVGQRLVAAVRALDTVARVGGDEFAVALWQVNGALDAASVASKLLETVSKQYGVRGRTVKITVSAGVAIYPAHGGDAAALLKSADLALHEAKRSGKNAYRVFDGEPLQQRRGHLAAVRPFARVIGRIGDPNR